MTVSRRAKVEAPSVVSDVSFRAAPLPAVLLAEDFRVLDANQAFLKLFGYTRAAIERRTLLDLVSPEERDYLSQQLRHTGSSGAQSARVDVRILTMKDKAVRVTAVVGPTGTKKGPVAFIGQFVEATFAAAEHQRLVEAIERAAFEWRMTFDAVETPIVIVNADRSVNRINRAARMLVGREYAEIIGHPLSELSGDEPWTSIDELALQVKTSRSAEARQIRDKSGRTLDLLAMLFNAHEPVDDRVIIIAWDVTALMDLQARLEQQRTMATMGALVAGVAHEVRNPLFAISATVDALEQAAPPTLQEYFSVLREEIDRMTSLMQDLLAYGRRSTTPFQPVAVDQIIESAVRASTTVAQKQKVTITSQVVNARVVGDRERLTRAVHNVVDNAVQHSESGATVAIRCRKSRSGTTGYVHISVTDGGPGFNLNDLPRVFEPFFSKRKGGTGLGLSLVQQIVTEHGGEVEAKNGPAGGAEVVLTLPLSS